MFILRAAVVVAAAVPTTESIRPHHHTPWPSPRVARPCSPYSVHGHGKPAASTLTSLHAVTDDYFSSLSYDTSKLALADRHGKERDALTIDLKVGPTSSLPPP